MMRKEMSEKHPRDRVGVNKMNFLWEISMPIYDETMASVFARWRTVHLSIVGCLVRLQWCPSQFPRFETGMRNGNYIRAVSERTWAVGNQRSRRIKEKTGARLIDVRPVKLVDPSYSPHEIWELKSSDWITGGSTRSGFLFAVRDR
jgi:hypothetical protein